MMIFMEIEQIKNWGFIFWPKSIKQLFLTLWSSHQIYPNLRPSSSLLHSVGNRCPIHWGQNINPRFLMHSISTNILMNLANFPSVIIWCFQKTSIWTMATLNSTSQHRHMELVIPWLYLMFFNLGEEGQCLAYMSPSGYNFKWFILTQAIFPFKMKTQHVML